MARGCGWLIGVALLLAPAAMAQPLPKGVALPPGVTADSLRGMTPDQAWAKYNSLDPKTKKALKDAAERVKAQYENDPELRAKLKQAAEQAKAQYENDPGLKEKLKAMLKAWNGQ
jgi:hypothetical protein